MKKLNMFIAILGLSFLVSSNIIGQTVERTYSLTRSYKVFCDGVIVDELYGTINYHYLSHYDNMGNLDWIKSQAEGTDLKSIRSGEVFEMTRVQKQAVFSDYFIVTFHSNLVGSAGSHYILMQTTKTDRTTWEISILKEEYKCW